MGLEDFLRESLRIEGIYRAPTRNEVEATEEFLALPVVTSKDVCRLQRVYAPGKPLRLSRNMNVQVGNHIAPQGGQHIGEYLEEIAFDASSGHDPWQVHCDFERLHPFMDGNGRTGRAIWLWQMCKRGDPYQISFLHRFYYQTLDNAERHSSKAGETR